MPWLFLDVDEPTMDRLKQNAVCEGVPAMTYVSELLRQKVARDVWPSSFWDTYGAITDETFDEPPELDFDDDAH